MPNITVQSIGSQTVFRRQQVKMKRKPRELINRKEIQKKTSKETCTEKLGTKKNLSILFLHDYFWKNILTGKFVDKTICHVSNLHINEII
jgi:hypothetical protein